MIGSHRIILNRYLAHGEQSLQAEYSRLIPSFASICRFDVWLTDAKHAYLHSSEPLKRKVYIKSAALEL